MSEQADEPDSNSGAARREGSTPSARTCECGIATNDPIHLPWHQIIMWNRDTFRKAKEKKEAEFDRKYNNPKSRRRTGMQPM